MFGFSILVRPSIFRWTEFPALDGNKNAKKTSLWLRPIVKQNGINRQDFQGSGAGFHRRSSHKPQTEFPLAALHVGDPGVISFHWYPLVVFSRMRSEGSRLIWGWGCVRQVLRLRSQPSATVRNRSQPFATVRATAVRLSTVAEELQECQERVSHKSVK